MPHSCSWFSNIKSCCWAWEQMGPCCRSGCHLTWRLSSSFTSSFWGNKSLALMYSRLGGPSSPCQTQTQSSDRKINTSVVIHVRLHMRNWSNTQSPYSLLIAILKHVKRHETINTTKPRVNILTAFIRSFGSGSSLVHTCQVEFCNLLQPGQTSHRRLKIYCEGPKIIHLKKEKK